DWQKSNDYPIEFMTEVTLNIAQDDELLRLMAQANFSTIFIGIESPRAASLQETHKTQNLRENILESVHRIQRAGIEVMANDRRVRQRRSDDLRRAVPIHPGCPYSRLDDGNAERRSQDAPVPASEGRRAAHRRVCWRPVRLHQHHSGGNVASGALRGL